MFKKFCGVALLGLAVQSASAFSLLGPFDFFQTAALAYRNVGDLGGPQNLGEEYRQVVPIQYYACDQTFLDYFGANGAEAMDQAFNVYNALTNVSSYSADLSEWTMDSQRVNYQAQALTLIDLKSSAMHFLAEQSGLANPVRFTWAIHDRDVGPGGCPLDVAYLVIKRNFDPAFTPLNQYQNSSYVNGTLYSYYIAEGCTGTPLADAVEYQVDPLAFTGTAVASSGYLRYGSFFTGLSRDDVGGLRYLLRTNNMNIEQAGVDTSTFITNNNTLQLLYSSNLTLFASQAKTNDAAALQALYPNLLIASTAPYFVNVVSTNPVYYFTNFPWSPYGSPATLVSNSLRSTNIETWYNHQFVNVVTNQYLTTSTVTVLTTNISTTACPPATPYGYICEKITSQTYTTNLLTGGFYIIPPNLCGVRILSNQLVQTVYVTNSVAVSTNGGATNIFNQFFAQSVIYSYQQYIYAINPVTCPENTSALRQGVEKVRYVRRDFDSLLSQYFIPITNTYTLYAITNSTLFPQQVQRVVTRPDFRIAAADLDTAGDTSHFTVGRNIRFTSNSLPSLNGPGTLETGNTLTWNKIGPTFINQSPNFMDEATAARNYTWGSFDGSTNPPVVYPNGTSIINLENQVLLQVSPAGSALPNGKLGVNYTNAFSGFTVTGGAPPYVWSVAPGSPGLPWGLSLNQFTGKISGVPLAQGTYDFTIRLTEAGARYVDRPYSLTITP